MDMKEEMDKICQNKKFVGVYRMSLYKCSLGVVCNSESNKLIFKIFCFKKSKHS